MSDEFRIPPTVVTGWGCLEELGRLAAPLGRKALVVTGSRAMKKTGLANRALGLLRAAGLETEIFDRVEREPDVATADEARAFAHEVEAEVVIGLGGGSALDLGKVVAGLYNETAATTRFFSQQKVETMGRPFVAVPTTSGTGSEASSNGVICDRARKIKASIRDLRFMPMAALVDPELTVPCPAEITATSGLDALCQAIESYISIHATPLTEALSIRSALDLATSVERAFRKPENQVARTRASYGSLMAGMALGNARLGVIHGIVHPLGVRYDIPHGLACGVLLPVALEYNRAACGAKYAVLSSILGGDAAEFARGLLDRMKLPADFKGFGVRAEDFEVIAEEAMPSGSLKANPRKVKKEDVVEMLRKVC